MVFVFLTKINFCLFVCLFFLNETLFFLSLIQSIIIDRMLDDAAITTMVFFGYYLMIIIIIMTRRHWKIYQYTFYLFFSSLKMCRRSIYMVTHRIFNHFLSRLLSCLAWFFLLLLSLLFCCSLTDYFFFLFTFSFYQK